jgi:hypothetical protein
MKIRRDIASIPARSAKETWRTIRDLITDTGSVDINQLDAAASVMESVIADEHVATVPLVIKGNGPRLVIYCLYGEDALEAGDKVERLNWNPTGGDWRLTAPCEKDDIEWMSRSLSTRAPRILLHDVGETPTDENTGSKMETSSDLQVDWSVLDKS